MTEEEDGVSWRSLGSTCILTRFLTRCLTITAMVKRRKIMETEEAITVTTRSQDTPGSPPLSIGVSLRCHNWEDSSSPTDSRERSSSLRPAASFRHPMLVMEELVVVVVVTHLVVVVVVVAMVVVVVLVFTGLVVGWCGPSVIGTPCQRTW